MTDLNVTIIPNDRNPNVLVLDVNRDILDPFSKVIIERNGAVTPYSPLAQDIFGKNASFTRVDLTQDPNGTLVYVTRRPLAWTNADEAKEDMRSSIESFTRSGQTALLTEAVQSNFQVQRSYNPGDNPVAKLVVRAFARHVLPITQRDNGSIEILDIKLDAAGGITLRAALMGQCGGCPDAPESTLRGAQATINAELAELRKQHTKNPAIQKLQANPIEEVRLPVCIFTRN